MANLILWSCVNAQHAPIRTVAPYQLAFWIRQHGYTVKVIDFCHLMSTDDLVAITEKNIGSDTLAIGVSSTFWSMQSSSRNFTEPAWVFNARQRVQGRNTLPWLLGGCGAESTNLKLEWVKFFGNAEDSLLKWLDENNSKLVLRKLFDIQTATKSFQADDFIQSNEVLPIELGRGCQFKCRFCSYPLIGKKKGTYLRDFNLIKEEFLRNFNEWGTTKYYFQDDTVNESEEKIEALADIVQNLPFELSWTGYNRLDLIWSRQNTIQLLKDSGLKSAYFGIESFHPVASMAVGKGWNGKHGKDFLLTLKEKWNLDINWYLSLIVGLPGETVDSLENTLQWCIDNEMHEWAFFPLHINRSPNKLWKSEFDREYEKYGYSFDGDDNMHNWKNKMWTRETAVEFSKNLRMRSEGYCKPSAWLLSELSTLGYSYNSLMNSYKKDLPWNMYIEETKSFVQRYVKHQLD